MKQPTGRQRGGNVRLRSPLIDCLEGHIEEFLGEIDDAKLFEKGVHVVAAAVKAIEHAEQVFDSAATLADAFEAGDVLRRVTHALFRLAQEQNARTQRLLTIIIPEVQRCYESGEARFEAVKS